MSTLIAGILIGAVISLLCVIILWAAVVRTMRSSVVKREMKSDAHMERTIELMAERNLLDREKTTQMSRIADEMEFKRRNV